MIDETSKFFAILTAVGEAKHANAIALGLDWMFTDMGVGDANGTDPTPHRLQTQLLNEWRRAPINQIQIDPNDPNIIIVEQVIPPDVGGRWIREIGVYDLDGDLVAVANCSPSYKPLLTQGSGKTQVVRMNFIVSSSANIILRIDPSIVLATREYVDLAINEALSKLDHKESVVFATTGAIALAGLDVQPGGDWSVALADRTRVLVKDQLAGKDNGLYLAKAGNWIRTTDSDASAKVTSGLMVAVEQGASLADTLWQLSTDGVIVLGTSALTFDRIQGIGIGDGYAPIDSPALINPTANTPPLFANDKRLATTEFVKRGSGNYRDVSHLTAAATLTTAAVGTLVTTKGAFAVTLPAADLMTSGDAIHFRNIGAGVVEVVCAGTDGINVEGNPVARMAIQPGGTLELVSDLAGWWMDGSTQLQYAQTLGVTPPRLDNSKALATTEFVVRQGQQYSGFTPIIGDTLGTLEHIGGVVHCQSGTGNIYSLPDATLNKLPLGATVRIQNWTLQTMLLRVQGTDLMREASNISGSAFERVIPADSYVEAIYIGTRTWLLAGTGMIGATSLFKSFKYANGYQILPTGLIFQWLDIGYVPPGGVATGHFSIYFPNVCLFAIAAARGTGSNSTVGNVVVGEATQSAVNLYNWGAFGAPAKLFAIGY